MTKVFACEERSRVLARVERSPKASKKGGAAHGGVGGCFFLGDVPGNAESMSALELEGLD